ncbi:N-acetylneuraminic acid mutarotase [Mucilaginibacter lappiensis]|uniref:N-acetylneuraminic acid mutarotase n=1 Tax=Mucilaginibacter lappiensis TaxID=354630 RepID=A0ABR6PJ08_9SPHI|nr:kelch repeat-containing protein [Mucilaginibacter lappiensis]MBB6109588.1 N-acetylneuraminic acid mutarotase [Mucilaginibacter lappiensis]SIR08525.1 N-acetylneuraminic acid mutarotase [Mucilaginibacter lappiensis]
MKILNLLCAFIVIAGLNMNKSQAQTKQPAAITFKSAANLPYPLTWTTSVTDGTYIYTISGYKGFGGFSSEVLKYDPQVNKWSVLANMGGNRIQTAAAYVPATGKIYVMGGIGGLGGSRGASQIFQGVQTVDVKTGKVENLHILNPMASTYGSAVEWNNKIYIFGGTRDGKRTLNSLYQFDPQTAKFTQLADMPESLQAAGAVVDGVIYTFGGFDAFTKRQSYSINAYDIKSNTWKKMGKLPEFLAANSVSACGDKVFVVGGYDDEDFIGYYDTKANQFVKLKSNMEQRRATASAVYNNYLFVFGGSTRFKAFRSSTLQTTQVANVAPFLNNSASK